MARIEQDIQRRIQEGETGPVRFQWADGWVTIGEIVECPHLSEGTHFALVPESVFDEEVECADGHTFFVMRREKTTVFHTERPEDFSPPVILSERKIEFGYWSSGARAQESSGG